ncbi:hypothetical protein GALL_398640 [mine drainage metagenome]|uniref:Uncharacterized protein n=1 Tax=mine drainage metagenome TaxID=410659 RepID=A0A1J5QLN4_9ZZZZ
MDDGAMLVHAIEIAGDGAGTDVHVAPYRGVADIAEVVDLAAGADLAVLDFDEIADVRFRRQLGAGPQARIGADAATFADRGAVDVGVGGDAGAAA